MQPGGFFRSASEALGDAFKKIQSISPIDNVEPTMGFEEFFNHQELSNRI